MTADLAWLVTLPGRCPRCLMHTEAQGHRARLADGTLTGCEDSGAWLGAVRRDEAFSRLDASDRTDESALLRRSILALGHRLHEFTADDLPAHVRETTNPNRRGRVFSELLDKGLIREVDRRKSGNPRAHGKKVGVYALASP